MKLSASLHRVASVLKLSPRAGSSRRDVPRRNRFETAAVFTEPLEQRMLLSVSASHVGALHADRSGSAHVSVPADTDSSATVTTVTTFDGSNGEYPQALVVDNAGDLFGVASGDATTNTGEVFEIPAGTDNLQVLYHFGGTTDGKAPDSLIIDPAGNLFGTTAGGGANGYGTVFEIPDGASTPQTLASFASYGPYHLAGVDSKGNLFGYDQQGSVFEVAAGTNGSPGGSGVVTTLVQGGTVNNVNSLLLASDGTLYGTASSGVNADDSSNDGVVFSIAPGSTTAVTLAAFPATGADGDEPLGIVLDSAGDIFGTTAGGGADGGGGAAFEIPKNGTLTLLASLNQSDANLGGPPACAPTLDSDGDLIGISSFGGANNYGAVWDISAASIASGSPAVQVLTPLPVATLAQQGGTEFAMVQGAAPGPAIEHLDQSATKPVYANLNFGGSSKEGSVVKIAKSSGSGGGSTSNPPNPKPQKFDWKELRGLAKDLANDYVQAHSQAEKSGGTQGSKSVRAERTVRPEALSATLTADFAQLKTMLNQINSELNTALPQINSATAFYTKYTAETNAITKLQTKLGAAKNAAAQAKIQAQINKDQALQTADANGDTTAYNNAQTDMDEASTRETNFQTELAAVKAAI